MRLKKKQKRLLAKEDNIKVLPKYEAFLMSFESKKQKWALPRAKFIGMLLESRKKVKEERKDRIQVEISDLLESLLIDK